MQNFCDYLIPLKFSENEIIYEGDSESPGIFIIHSGTVFIQKFVEITKYNKWPIGKNQ